MNPYQLSSIIVNSVCDELNQVTRLRRDAQLTGGNSHTRAFNQEILDVANGRGNEVPPSKEVTIVNE